jgi:hypothetical protein
MVAHFLVDRDDSGCPFFVRKGQWLLLLLAAGTFAAFVSLAGDAARNDLLDDPSVAVCPAATRSEFHGEMAAFGQPPNNLLDAVLGDATSCGKMRDAGPGEALPFVDEIGEYIDELEGERGQLGIGANLFQPEKFGARKGGGAAIMRVDAVRAINLVV